MQNGTDGTKGLHGAAGKPRPVDVPSTGETVMVVDGLLGMASAAEPARTYVFEAGGERHDTKGSTGSRR